MRNPTIKEAINWANEIEVTDNQFLADDIAFLIGERLGLSPTQLKLKQNEKLSDLQTKQLQDDFERLKKGESPQYILGYAWFFGYKIKVTPDVLIPRFDTENLVAWARDDLLKENRRNPRVLDLGTGSGAITIALAEQIRDANIFIDQTASDISKKALVVANINFHQFDLDVKLKAADVLEDLSTFDVIISNPPYIKTTETKIMDDSVLNNEPNLALFAGEDGLDFYRKFVQQVDHHLNPQGHFYLEFGLTQQPDLEKLFAQFLPNYKIEFRTDLSNHPRMVKGSKL